MSLKISYGLIWSLFYIIQYFFNFVCSEFVSVDIAGVVNTLKLSSHTLMGFMFSFVGPAV